MRFHLVYPSTSSKAQSPVRVVEQTGREVGWINRFLDREYVRRLAEKTLRTYAHNLLHFVRWWESVHHTGDIVEGDLAESTLLDYGRFQSGAHNQGLPDPPSTTASPWRIAPYAMSSPMPLARSLAAFIKPSCGAGRWALDGRGWRSADCA